MIMKRLTPLLLVAPALAFVPGSLNHGVVRPAAPSHLVSNNFPTTSSRIGSVNPFQPVVKASSTTLQANPFVALHGNSGVVLAIVAWLSTIGISLERRTTFGKALSAPLVTMLLALVVANLGVLPFASPVYTMVNQFLVPLAIPMLLFDSDLRRVAVDTGRLLPAFVVGAIATVVGTVGAYALFPLTALGGDVGWRVAAALCARHIGGAINFVAVSETLNVGSNTISAALAADNLVVALYFAFLFSRAKPGMTAAEEAEIKDAKPTVAVSNDGPTYAMELSNLAIALSCSTTLVAAGRWLTTKFLPGVSALPAISMLSVLSATAFPKFFSRIADTGTALGIAFIQMFFAASGAAGSIAVVLKQAPKLFAFSFMQISIHFWTLMTIGKFIFRLPYRELYLASNANVGGPTTAAAMAQAKEWKKLVVPALLVGILGYATATPIALLLGPYLAKLTPLF